MKQPARARRRNRLGRLGLVVVCAAPALVLASCGSRCGSKKQAEVDKGDAQAANVEVLDPGKAPRVQLAVGRWSGLAFTTEYTSDGSIGIVGAPPIKAPTTVMRVGFDVQRGTADPVIRPGPEGEQRLVQQQAVIESLVVRSDQLPPAAVQKFNESLAALAGTSMIQLVGEDGAIVDVKTQTVGGTEPPARVKKMLDDTWSNQRHFPFRLPPAAVGVGAHWRFSDPIDRQGIHAIQVADMTLLSMDDKVVKIRIRVRRSAPRQEIKNPMDPDATAMLEQYRGDGEGELTMDRLTAVVLGARLATTASLKLSAINSKGETQFRTLVAATLLQSHSEIGSPEAAAPAAPASASAAPAPTPVPSP